MSEYKENDTPKAADDTLEKEKIAETRKKNITARILCFLGAVFIWFYAVSTHTQIDERRFTAIPVEIKSAETLEDNYGMTVISGYDYSIDVTLSGTINELSRVDIDEIRAYVDLSNIENAGEYELDVNVAVPSGVSVKELSANNVRVYVDKRSSKNVEIKVNANYIIEQDYYSIGTPETSLGKVMVTGPANELEKVTHAQVNVDVGKLTRSVTTTGTVELYAGNTKVTNPYVKTTQSDVVVFIPVFENKELPLEIELKHGFYNNKNVQITVEPKKITVKGDPAVLEQYPALPLMTIDEKSINTDVVTRSMVISLPEGVLNMSGETVATVTIKQIGTTTRDLSVKNITVKNPGALKYTCQHDNINVTLRGSAGSLALINGDNISVVADLSYYENKAGRVNVPLEIILPDSLKGEVYELGQYSLEFDIQ